MYIFITVLVLAGVTFKLLPSIKLRGIFIGYYIVLYILMAGITGLVTADESDKFSASLMLMINSTIFFLHLPLIYKLYQLDHKKKLVQTAREIFGEHVWGIDDHKLHRHLHSD